MASLRDYFDTDFARSVQLQTNLTATSLTARDARSGTFAFTGVWDEEANARYSAFFVPADIATADMCMKLVDDCEELYKQHWAGLRTIGGTPTSGRFDNIDSDELVPTKQIFIYLEREVSDDERDVLRAYGRGRDRVVRIRDLRWAQMREGREKPLVFISHDSRDKDEVARPLAQALTKLACPVWFDEFSLQIGDSLRTSIERGLKDCKGCVLVLTQNFFSNGGWTKMEFDSVFQREILERQNVVLPIWSGISKQDVYEYCPRLLDRVGLQWSEGPEQVARKIKRALERT